MGDQSDVGGSKELITLEEARLGPQAKSKFLKQGYRLVGDHDHSAVKLCHWTKSAAKGGMACYKNSFYGIASHRCVQMTPSLPSCNYACNFCWRDHFGNEPTLDEYELDDPVDILDASIDAQKELLTGYKGNPYVEYSTWLEATDPKHIAVSLNGEPTNYPHLSEFFAAAHDRGISTFLVTNGSNPDTLRALTTLPTQIYLSVDAPNEEVFERVCNPLLPNLWSRFQETVDLFPTLATRTVCRHTLVKGENMRNEFIPQYAEILKRARPMFIESKGYSHMGPAMKNLERDNMPTHEEVRDFTRTLLAHLPSEYEFVNEREESRVTLLSRIGPNTVIEGFEGNVKPTPTAAPLYQDVGPPPNQNARLIWAPARAGHLWDSES